MGSPPHARGRRFDDPVGSVDPGITPACAGKTFQLDQWQAGDRDHPRMRGEDPDEDARQAPPQGSPPHARGRLRHQEHRRLQQRITPACAGKTLRRKVHCEFPWDHPRMRGEDCADRLPCAGEQGSPPHARGRLELGVHALLDRRITPACAGKTATATPCVVVWKDHPRMRGEDSVTNVGSPFVAGSPPHARGRQLDYPGNPTKSSSSLPVFLHSQPSPLKRFLRRVLGL